MSTELKSIKQPELVVALDGQLVLDIELEAYNAKVTKEREEIQKKLAELEKKSK